MKHPSRRRRKPMNTLRSRRRKKHKTETVEEEARVNKLKNDIMNNQAKQA